MTRTLMLLFIEDKFSTDNFDLDKKIYIFN